MNTEPFDPYMQRVIVRLAFDDQRARSVLRQLVEARYYTLTDRMAAWAWYLLAGGSVTTLAQLRNEANRLPATDPVQAFLGSFLADPDYRDQQYARDELVKYAKLQTFRRSFDEARELWHRQRYEDAYAHMQARFEEINQLHISDADRGWHFDELDERMEDRRGDRAGMLSVPTGIEPFDQDGVLNGGLRRGHTGLFLAYTNIGKTYALVDQGWGACRMHFNVLHITVEGGRSYIQDKYDARFTQVKIHAVERGQIERERLEWAQWEYDRLRRRLVVRGSSDKPKWTIEDTYAELHELHQERGWVPDLVVFDYADEMDTDGEDERVRQMNAVRQLHKFGMYRVSRSHPGHALWTAAQAVRPPKGAELKEHVLWINDIGEAYAKTKPVEVIVSINITEAERQAGWARLALAKNRHGGGVGTVVRVQTNYSVGEFVRPGGIQERAERRPKGPPPPPLEEGS